MTYIKGRKWYIKGLLQKKERMIYLDYPDDINTQIERFKRQDKITKWVFLFGIPLFVVIVTVVAIWIG